MIASSYKKVQELAEEFAKCRTGIFAAQSDHSAVGVIRGLQEKGINVPVQVGVCGYDNMEIAHSWNGNITSVNTDFINIGVKSLEFLQRQIEKPDASPQKLLILEKLIPRSTTISHT